MTDVTQTPPDLNLKAIDILDRIRMRNTTGGSVDQTPPKINEVEDPLTFYIRATTEKGQEAMIFLIMNPQNVDVTGTPGQSIYKVIFRDAKQASYFKLKYSD